MASKPLIGKPITTRILVVTDCEFWLNRTGAQQRILTLVRYLANRGATVRVLFAGQLSVADDLKLSDELFQVEPVFKNQPPQGIVNRLVWHIKGTWHWCWTRIQSSSPSDAVPSDSKSIADFYSHALMKRFRSLLDEWKPENVIVEYVSMAYLMMGVSAAQKSNSRFLIDTHDVMHSRCAQFQEAGYSHWINISRDEESALLDEFDRILAITRDEQAQFQTMVKSARAIVAGHPMNVRAQSGTKATTTLAVGYFGSANASNESAIRKLVSDVWPQVLSSVDCEVELVIAGGVCEQLQESNLPKCRLLGQIDDVAEFYDQVQIVVNPVEFGTGLKIKNLEALAFGKCLVTTEAGATGMPGMWQNAVCVASVSDDFASTLVDLAKNPSRRQELSEAAHKYVNEQLNQELVYEDLIVELCGGSVVNQCVSTSPQSTALKDSCASSDE